MIKVYKIILQGKAKAISRLIDTNNHSVRGNHGIKSCFIPWSKVKEAYWRAAVLSSNAWLADISIPHLPNVVNGCSPTMAATSLMELVKSKLIKVKESDGFRSLGARMSFQVLSSSVCLAMLTQQRRQAPIPSPRKAIRRNWALLRCHPQS